MKKLLSLLSVLTITGTAVPTTIAASLYQKEETIKNIDINYQQTNNLENLNRKKRASHERKFEKWYRFLASDSLKARLSFEDAGKINSFFENTDDKNVFIQNVVEILELLPQSDHSGTGGSITNDDYKTVAKAIWEKYSLFHSILLNFSNKQYKGGITVSTLVSGGYWSDECTIFETGTGCDL